MIVDRHHTPSYNRNQEKKQNAFEFGLIFISVFFITVVKHLLTGIFTKRTEI